jgi:hypothetical protein
MPGDVLHSPRPARYPELSRRFAGPELEPRKLDPVDELKRLIGDSVIDPAHQANAPKFPDRRRQPHGRR